MRSVESSQKKRIDFIDALRGYVILMMLQGHTITLTLADDVKEAGGWLYNSWHYLTGMTAPAFFFTSGMIFSYLLVRDDDEEKVNLRLKKGLKRGGFLLVIGFVLQMNLRAIVELVCTGKDYNLWLFLSRTTVLHTIGLSLIILVGLFVLCRRLRWRFEWVAGGLGVLAFVIGPATYLLPAGEGLHKFWTVFVVKKQSYFPIFLWVGFPLFGAVFGVMARRFAWYKSGRFLLGLAVGGLLLSHVGNGFANLLAAEIAPLFGYEVDQWWSVNAGMFYRLGEVLTLVALMAWLVEMAGGEGWRPQWLLNCGRETLTIFVFHIVLLYGGVIGFGFGRPPLRTHLSHVLPAGFAVLLAIVVVVTFALMAQVLPKWRKKCRWLALLK